MKKQIFETAAVGRSPKRNKFDLGHERKLTMKMGQLVPICVIDCLPSDSFTINSEMLIRFAPMLAPMMHRVDATVHFFFVPNRIIWVDWDDFMTGGPSGTLAPVMPYIETSGLVATSRGANGTLWDYMGFGSVTSSANSVRVQSLPFRAYRQIYNDWYIDQNLQTPLAVPTGSGDDSAQIAAGMFDTLNRAWEKDYYTSALPWPQRGPDVLIPISGTGTVQYLSTSLVKTSAGVSAAINTLVGTGPTVGTMFVEKTGAGANGVAGRIENISSVTFTNLDATMNDLRIAEATQKWYELSARGGSRYVEQNEVIYGVRNQDARMQRSEYLGGGKIRVQVSEVVSTFQTANPSTDLPQGNMSGHGVAFGRSNRAKYFCPEHGWIIGILSVLPRTDYYQGIPRKFSRLTKFDYYWPQFAHLGEQEILNKELYYTGAEADSTSEATFGYQSRYCEYKFENNTVHSYFRGSLLYWTLVRSFSATPVLNSSFITADPSTRIFAVTAGNIDNLYVQVFNSISAFRPIPYNSIPNLI